MGLGPFPELRIVRIMQKRFVKVYLCRAHATWDEVGLYLRWYVRGRGRGLQSCVLFVWLLLVWLSPS